MTLRDRFQTLPRAARWLILAGVGLALYFPLIDAPLAWWSELDQRADAMEASLQVFAAGASPSLAEDLELGAARHGRLAPPAGRAQASERLDRAISAVFEARGVSDYSVTSRSLPMPAGDLSRLLGRPLERLVREIQFEAPEDSALSIVADLERSEAIYRATGLQVQRLDDAGILRVRITIEGWALADGGGR